MSKHKRVAAFFYSEKAKPGFTAIPLGEGLVGYVRGTLTPKGTGLIGAIDWVHDACCPERYPEGECFMNSHFASESEDVS